MEKKFVLIFFLAAVVMSFAAGFIFKDVIPLTLFDHASDPFEDITNILDDAYYYDINDEVMLEAYIAQLDAIVDAYGSYFNDPYTRLEVLTSQSSDLIGLGIRLYFDGLIPIVSSVSYDAPAYLKLYPGDRMKGIVLEDNILFETLSSTDDVIGYLTGDIGDIKTLIVENADGELRELSITLDIISSPNIELASFSDENISYIKIHEFRPYVDQNNPGTAQLFKETLNQFESEGMDENHTLIIDLRDNPGGSLSALHNLNFPEYPIGIIQQLIPYDPDMPAFNMVDHDGVETTFFGGLRQPKPYEIAVLVNENSASASEVLAASLSTFNYQVYGMQTFGKHVYQNQMPLTQINDITYMLIYTEGIWSYRDDLTINEHPLDITFISKNPYEFIQNFSYNGLFAYDDVDPMISTYQKFLNTYFDETIREDGYFDLETQEHIRLFQEDRDIEVTGVINYETFKHMYEVYMEKMHQLKEDTQLNTLIEMLS